jgi:hypothetical protein
MKQNFLIRTFSLPKKLKGDALAAFLVIVKGRYILSVFTLVTCSILTFTDPIRLISTLVP